MIDSDAQIINQDNTEPAEIAVFTKDTKIKDVRYLYSVFCKVYVNE